MNRTRQWPNNWWEQYKTHRTVIFLHLPYPTNQDTSDTANTTFNPILRLLIKLTDAPKRTYKCPCWTRGRETQQQGHALRFPARLLAKEATTKEPNTGLFLKLYLLPSVFQLGYQEASDCKFSRRTTDCSIQLIRNFGK